MWWNGLRQKARAIKQEKFIGYRYNLELCEKDGNCFLCRGWVAGYEEPIREIEIVYTSGQECRRRKLSWIQRSDVEQAMGTRNALWSGFSVQDKIDSGETVRAELVFRIKGKEKTIFLAEFLKNSGEKETVFCIRPLHENGPELKEVVEKRMIRFSTDRLALPEEMIDVIVPVYNGMSYLPALFATIPKTGMDYRLIVVDDCSSDPEVQEYLKDLEEKNFSVILKRNPENLGFVRSVNIALSLAKHPVALVNTDVELPEFWLERLMYPILKGEKVASSTPFTTCGTICSFPRINEDNKMFQGLSLEAVDSVFRSFRPAYAELPTGVGFCMGMSLKAIRDVGLFDEETFGKGYGEENDWCLRAEKAGYQNVMVENLFVYHKHGGSFLSEDKKRYLETNARILQERYPDYSQKLARHFERDPAKEFRDLAIWQLNTLFCIKRTRFYLDHSIGGGASHYLETRVRREWEEGDASWLLRYSVEKGYLLSYRCGEICLNYTMNHLEDWELLFRYGRIKEIVINELVTYPELPALIEEILRKKKEYGLMLTMLLHDYYAICPSVNLLNEEFAYCGLEDFSHCNECLAKNEANLTACRDIDEWRRLWGRLLKCSDRIVAFSESTAGLLQRAYPFIKETSLEDSGLEADAWKRVQVLPHKVDYLRKLGERKKKTKTFNIGILGLINRHKGLDIVREAAEELAEKEKDFRIIILGSTTEEILSDNVTVTGPYRKEELGEWIQKYDIDVIWIPSICPETFSYTTEEGIQMGLPVVVFNLGAQAERVKKYERGVVIPEVTVQAALETFRKYKREEAGKLQN
ncbi:MAG: glycosyltransferase [Lachnospiraceae bacterium]|nr:glycosyltransferase [Lachnospiraceae bacterium]